MPLSRSQQMARIRGKNTGPELLLRRALAALGLRYRVHYNTPAGRVDVAFVGPKVAVEVDGCFWHGCPKHYVRPRSAAAFWSDKLKQNVDRDCRQTATLLAAGWSMLRYWEHDVVVDPNAVAADVAAAVHDPAGARRRQQRRRNWRVSAVIALDESSDTEVWTLVDLTRSECARKLERRRGVPVA